MSGTADALGVGVVGLGSIGQTHARALAELGSQVRLVAGSGGRTPLADLGWPEAKRLSPAEVISHPDVDAVAVCSPSHTHADVTLAAVAAGKHVLVEKPLALSVADADRIAARARAEGVVVSMVAQRRLEPEYRYLRDAFVSGRLGDLRLAVAQVHWWRDADYYRAVDWRSSMADGGGSLMNQGMHSVDLLRWLCGEVTEVSAQYGTLGHDIDAEDTTVATVRFASGALGLVSTSTATPPGRPATIGMFCSSGTVELGQGEVLRWDVDVPPPPTTAGPASGAADPAAIGVQGHAQVWRDSVAAVREGRPPAVTVDDAVGTVRLLRAIYRAAETHASVRLAEVT